MTNPTHPIPGSIVSPADVDELVLEYPSEWADIAQDAFWVQYRQPDNVPDLDANGDPVLDADGNPVTHPVTVQEKSDFLHAKLVEHLMNIIEAYLLQFGESATGATTAEKRASVEVDIGVLKGLAKQAIKVTKRKKAKTLPA